MSRGGSANPAAASASTSARARSEQPPRNFPNEQFLAVCRELTRSSEGADPSWQLLTQSMGFNIYRRKDEKSGLYEYKIYGTLENCSPDLCADVYMDLHYRIKWDEFLKGFLDIITSYTFLFSNKMNRPEMWEHKCI